MNRRKVRLQALCRRIFAECLFEVDEGLASSLSISRVEFSDDLLNLKIFWCSAETSKKKLSFISHRLCRLIPMFRHYFARKIKNIRPPNIIFKFDSDLETASQVLRALNLLELDKAKRGASGDLNAE
ncbi:MAG: hypothetical protein NZO16_05290 [Deltaproteobacteria bacterium]|nr:hypothetical protein [Deltaproteobacteria bacterium]